MLRLLRDFLRLLHAWLTCDRVRSVSPMGDLARLQPGESLLIDGELATIISRRKTMGPNEATIELACAIGQRRQVLRLRWTPDVQRTTVEWDRSGEFLTIDPEAVIVPRRVRS